MTRSSHRRLHGRTTSLTSPLLLPHTLVSNMLPTIATIILLSTTAISTVVAQDCTTITDWQSLRTAIVSLKKSQKTLVLCPFAIDHAGIAQEDGIDLYKKGLTLVCQGQTGDVGDDTMYRGSPSDGSDEPIPIGCTIKSKARHFNILADDIALVGLTFSHSQNGAVSVGDSIVGTTISNCHFHDNNNVRGDGGAIILGPRSTGTFLVGSEFNNNGAWGGGAVSGVGSDLDVQDCLFRGNRANIGVGGAIKLSDEDTLGSRQLLSRSAREKKQTTDGRELNHKSERSQPAVSSLALNDSRFMSNTGAIAGPAVYMESRSDGTNTYIATTMGGNYACANLGLKSSTMCNGISNGKQCVPFTNTCDSDGFDGDGDADADADEIDLSSPSDATIGIEEDGSGAGVANSDGGDETDVVRDGGTTGISDDFGPETGPPPEDIVTGGDDTNGDFRDGATTATPTFSKLPTPVPTSDPTHDPTMAPTFVPTATPTYNPTAEPTVRCNVDIVTRHSMILTQLESISDATDLRRTSTPQGKAVDWLVYVDSMYLCPDDTYLIQRYVLAVLYYATNGHQGWLTCSRTGDVAANDCPQTTKRFLSNYHVCTWAGIGCNGSNFVTRIAFEDNGLSGSIPAEIGALSSLKTLRMERGKLSGSLPATLGDLTNLEKLDLDYNNLWGTLPSTLDRLTNLRLIDLNSNDLSGSIDVLAGLSNLFFVQLQSNFFSGTVSEAFGSLSQLQVFSVQENQMNGGIALGFCNLRISGHLEHLEADCSSPANGGTVDCVCCTKCYPYDDSSLNNADGVGNGEDPIISTPSPTSEAPSPKPTRRPTTEPTHKPTPEATNAPSPFTNAPTRACGGINKSAWKESIINMLASSGVSTRSSLLTNGSPQAKAVWWILNQDPMRLCPGDERIQQRYLAALFYYSTDGPNWLDTGNGDQKFLGSESECYWMGLQCNAYGEITHIEIENNGLGGSLPYEIASLTKLEVLSLEKGGITGRIPTEIGTLQELRELDLDFNMLTGELPYTLGDAPKLNVIDLNSNMLTGSISVLAKVREAYFVQLHNNKFTGAIAPAIGLLGNLQVLTLHKNDLTGVMPIMVCNRLAAYGGAIDHLWADCEGAVPKVSCSCCTKCFEG